MATVLLIDGEPATYCPACKCMHPINVTKDGRPKWSWNGDVDLPTFSPSVNVSWGTTKGDRRCHYFVRGGNVEFCGDSTHELAGKTVPLPEVPADEVDFWTGD